MGWNTVAIIPELDAEIKKGNSEKYKKTLAKMVAIEGILNDTQGKDLSQEIIEEWKQTRKTLRYIWYNCIAV